MTTNLPPLTGQQYTAIGNFLSACTVPILKARKVRGTGTLFQVGGEHFLVTAGHVKQGTRAEDLSIPTDGSGLVLESLAGANAYWHDDKAPTDPDLALLRLRRDTAASLALRRFLTLENVFLAGIPPQGSPLFVCGFPFATNPHGLQRPEFYLTEEYPDAVESFTRDDSGTEIQVDRYHHFFLCHSTQALDQRDGSLVETPKLHGISGCSVWVWGNIPDQEIWTPERAVKVLAVQVGYRSDWWIRATYWAQIMRMMHVHFPATRAEIEGVAGSPQNWPKPD